MIRSNLDYIHVQWHSNNYLNQTILFGLILDLTGDRIKDLIHSLVSGPSHVFQRTQEKSGRPGRSGDVIRHG